MMVTILTRYNSKLNRLSGVFFTLFSLCILTGDAYSWNPVKCGCACDSSILDECAPKCASECKKSKCAAKLMERDNALREIEEKKQAAEERDRRDRQESDAERMRNERSELAQNYDARRREEAIRREGKKVIDAREKEMAARRY